MDYVREGSQVICTTQSEHFLMALLQMVLEGSLSPTELSVYYIDQGRAQRLTVDEQGRLSEGLRGFFEANEEQLRERLELLEQRAAPLGRPEPVGASCIRPPQPADQPNYLASRCNASWLTLYSMRTSIFGHWKQSAHRARRTCARRALYSYCRSTTGGSFLLRSSLLTGASSPPEAVEDFLPATS